MNPLIAVLCLATHVSAPHPPHEYTLAQYMAITRANDPSFSPNADRVAYTTNASGNWQLWVTPVAKSRPRQLTHFKGGTGGIEWSPTGEAILAMADRSGDQNYQFYIVHGVTGAMTRVTSGDTIQNNFGGWMPDGKSIFYTSNARDRRYFDCYVMNVETRHAQLVYQHQSVLRAIAASHDGALVAVEDAHSEVDNDVLIVDTKAKTARNITEHKGNARFAVVGFSPDGRTLYFRTNADGEFMSVASGSVEGGSRRVLIGGQHDVDYAVLDPAGTRMAISENVNGYEELSLWDLKASRRLPLPDMPKGISMPQHFSADGSKLVLSLNTPVHDDEVWVADLQHGTARRVTYSPQGGVAESSCVSAQSIQYTSFDGRSIPALLYVPRGSSPNRPAPVVMSIHGGPEEQEQPYTTNYYQFLIARGYAILAPNVRGSTGYGKSYVALDNGALRWDALKDVAWAVKWIGSQDYLDSSKVACFGPSYGGFTTLAMLAHYPDLFRAGVDFFGPADLATFLGRTAEYRRGQRIAEYGDPVRDSVFMAAISPARHATSIKRPLLVVQGANDPIVPPAESEDIIRLIRANGGTAEYLLFPGEGHGLSKEQDYVKAFEAMLAFLRTYMPPPR